MDVFLSAEAERFLRAAARLGKGPLHGYLLGHRRGPRRYVESIIPLSGPGPFSCGDIRNLDLIFDGRTIGFFVLGGGTGAGRLHSEPFACGRVLLEAKRGRGSVLTFKAFVIDYDGRFHLSPVPVIRTPERRGA